MSILIQFVYRLAFGLALSMALTPSRQVPAGYFRVHSYVLLGLNALAALVAWRANGEQLAVALAATLMSYAAAAVWLYQYHRPGTLALFGVAGLSLAGAAQTNSHPLSFASAGDVLWSLDPATSGLVLGSTMAAMLLGHWYLNTPSMQLAPLRRLILLMGIALALRAVICGAGLALQIGASEGLAGPRIWFVVLRWLSGMLGTAGVAVMSWQTLKIPNTQSATGILYVGVITTFISELTSQLLSDESLYPL